MRSTKFFHVYLVGIHFFALEGHLVELLGRLGAGVNRKYLVRSTKFVHVYLLGIYFFAFQGHLLELLGCLGAGVNRKYLVRSTRFVHVYILGIHFFSTPELFGQLGESSSQTLISSKI